MGRKRRALRGAVARCEDSPWLGSQTEQTRAEPWIDLVRADGRRCGSARGRWRTGSNHEPADGKGEAAGSGKLEITNPNTGTLTGVASSTTANLDIPAGTAVRFEPGQQRTVELVAVEGNREIYGFAGQVMGKLKDKPDGKIINSSIKP